jgi:hypothetical protein
MRSAAITEDEYWRMFHSVRGDVEASIKCNYAYFMIHGLARANRTTLNKYQRHAHFWSLNSYALQTTFFIAFGRIFDERKDCFSIQKLIKATISNPAIFSKAALRARRRKNDRITGADPAWLVTFINEAWEPTVADLKRLSAGLAPHEAKFKAIYRPIRHVYFAHRGMASQQAIQKLFAGTLKKDVVTILKFLHTVLWAIQQMSDNGRRPELNNFADYGAFVKSLNEQIEGFVKALR